MAFLLFILAAIALAAGAAVATHAPSDIQLGIAATCLIGAFLLFGIAVLLLKVDALRGQLREGGAPNQPRREPRL